MATKPTAKPAKESAKPDWSELFRLLFEKSPQYIALLSLLRDAAGQVQDWQIQEINPALLKLFGPERKRLVGMPASQFYQHYSDFAFMRELVDEVNATGEARQVERYLNAYDRTVRLTLQPFDDDLLLVTGVDVSEYKDISHALAESRRRLSFITTAAQVGLLDWDLIADVHTWNDQCKRIFGLPLKAEVTYQTILDAVHPDDRARVNAALRAAIDERSEYDIEFRVVWPRGSQHWIHAKGRAFHDASGRPVQLSGLAIDVTRRRKAEIQREEVAAMHKAQNELLDHLVKEAPVGIAMLEGPEHIHVLANPAYRRLIGEGVDPIGKRVGDVWPEAAEQAQAILDRVYTRGEHVHGVDMPFPIRRGGEITLVYLTYTVSPYFNAAREVVGTVALVQDNTAQVLAHKQIEIEQSRLETFIRSAPVGILLVDEEGRMVRANPVIEELFARPILFGQPLEQQGPLGIYLPDGAPVSARDLPFIRSVLDGESIRNLELIIAHPDGNKIVLASSAPVLDPEGRISGAVGVFQDITERRKAIEARMKAAAQIEVQHYLMQSRELERLQIAQQLHEGLLQDLIGLQFLIEEMLDRSEERGRNDQLRVIQRALAGQIRELRDYCYDLRPPALAPFGLEKAIRSHVDSIREKHPDLNLHLNLLPDMQFLPETIRLALFRVYQEVISNVLHHSGAKNVWIRFVFNSHVTQLYIRDDGTGFRVPEDWVEAVRSGRLGLAAAQERVESVGGRMKIESTAGGGTTVEVTVPLISRLM